MNRIAKTAMLGTEGRFLGIEAFKLDGTYRRFNGKVESVRVIPGRGTLVTIKEAKTGNYRSFYAERTEMVNADKTRIELVQADVQDWTKVR